MLDAKLRGVLLEAGKAALIKDFTAIKQELLNRRITKLFHFTHSSNLKSIMEIGLQTKTYLLQNSIKFIDSDQERLDGVTNSISFSIGKPNTYLLNVKNSKLNHKLVILEIAANNLLTQPFAAFPANAAKSWFREGEYEKISRYVGIKGLRGMYLHPRLRQECAIPSAEPTDVQSEILFFEPVGSRTILRIHVSKSFPESDRVEIRDLIKLGGLPPIHGDCDCRIFEKQSGQPRIYSPDWESYGK